MNSSTCFFIPLLLCLPFASGCGGGIGDLKGKVSFENQTVCSGSVTVFGGDGLVKSAPIGADGSYHVKDIAAGTIKIIVNSPQPGVAPKNPSTRPGKQMDMPRPPGDADKWFAIPGDYAD